MCVYSYMFGLMKARRKSSVVRVGLLLVALLVSVFFVGGTAWADSGEYFGFLDIKIAPDNNKKNYFRYIDSICRYWVIGDNWFYNLWLYDYDSKGK